MDSSWPPNFIPGFISGRLDGLQEGYKQGRADLEAEMAALQAAAVHAVLGNSRLKPNGVHWAAVHARQIARCEELKREAVPWPDEDP